MITLSNKDIRPNLFRKKFFPSFFCSKRSNIRFFSITSLSLLLFHFNIPYLIPLFQNESNFINNKNKTNLSDVLPKKANATYQFFPTNGARVTGTEQTITSATASAGEGVNLGSWKGTLADDNFHWQVASTASGIDVNLTVGAVDLHGANMLMIETEVDLDTTAPNLLFQICDWTSSTGVDAVADSECTTGGWRTLNLRKTAFTSATATAFHFQIYDGYWSDGSNTPRSTPLTNFVNSNQIKVRYYASNNTTSVVSIDYLRIFAVINPVYSPAGFTNSGSGASSGDYTDTVLGVGQSGSDDNRNGAAGTSGTIPDMYWSFKNVKTPGGTNDFNTILVRSEYSCSATGINFRPKIFNFTSGLWEDLTTGNIACATGDATNAWAKNNITISDYISSGEIRVGFYGLANGTNILRADLIYIMLGRTNTDTGVCEISFGTNSANDCSYTRDLDMTAASPNTWNIATADESGTMGAGYYPNDNDADANTEEAAASHVKVSLDEPSNSIITSVFFASRHMSGTAGTVQPSLCDYSGYVAATGGFTDIGASATTSLVYTDNVSVGTIASGGIIGTTTDPYRYQQSVSDEMWMRLRTSASGATTNNSVNQWDFSMVSFQWIEDSSHPSKTFQFTPTASYRTTGTAQNITSILASAAEGINVGGDTDGWKGTLADDNYHWAVASTASGLDMDLTFGNFALNGANTIILETEFDLDATAPGIVIQLCDWVSSTSVDAAADSRCTTGGWRTVNIRKVAMNGTGNNGLHNEHYQVYDGYWSDGSNAPLSTPLANFVDGSNNVRVRFYSSVNTTSVFSLDFVRLYAFISPLYLPADLTNSGSGSIVGDYKNAQIGYFAGSVNAQSGSDDTRSGAAGTAGSIPDFYFSFDNIETFTGMNSILVRSEHRCSAAAGLTYRPRIWNFSAGGGSGAWEDLTTGTILCSTTDATHAWAKNNVTLSNYISSGEMRIGFYGLGNSTASIEADYIYVMLGMTNSDSSKCEISFGTGTTTDCTKTRDLDMTGTQSAWMINPEAESTSFSHTYYAIDNGTTPDTVPEGMASGHVRFTPGGSPSGMIANVFFSQGFVSGFGYSTVISGTSAGSLFDYSGMTATGGSVNVGSTATNTLVYSDSVSIATYANLGANGVMTNAEDYVDTLNNEIWMRFKSTAGRIVAVSDGGSLGVDWGMIAFGWIETASNSNPNTPSSLAQLKTDDTNLTVGSWTNETSVKFTATVSDPDSNQVQLCVEKDILGTSFSDSEDSCGTLVSSGTTASVTIASQTDASEYHWQARTKDSNGAYSAWVSFGGNAESARDYGIDTTAPTGGSVYDGTSGDQDWNDGSLTQISGNWTGFNANVSGLSKYEYAIRRKPDDYYWSVCSGAGVWQVGANWCDNTTSTSFTQNTLNLATGVTYYVSVRATDNATNVGTTIDSNGQQVLPLLSFSLSANTVAFNNLNATNSYTDTKTITTTTSTNASNGYTIKVYNIDNLRSVGVPATTIPDFSGTWTSPASWVGGQYGFGYTSNDTSVQGSNRFSGGTAFAAFTQTPPGDVVADHTDVVNGTTGAITNQQFTITYKVATSTSQAALYYQTTSIFIVTANY